jgi:hypothetical protein
VPHLWSSGDGHRRISDGELVIGRTLSVWTVLALVSVLSGVLVGLWNRYLQETGFGDDAQAYRAMSGVSTARGASAEE